MTTRLAVISLWAADVPQAAHFYRDVIGLRLIPHHAGGRPHFDLGGAYLTLLAGRPRPAEAAQPENFPVVAFAVDDLEAARARLDAHGVAQPWGVEAEAGARWVKFYDPAGNLIELVQFGEAP